SRSSSATARDTAGKRARRHAIEAGAAAARRASMTFEALLADHHDALLARARALCRSSADADDLLHDAIELALRGYPTMRGPERARSWLFAILRNAFIDRVRREQLRQASQLLEDVIA